jgi:hypothetical protein
MATKRKIARKPQGTKRAAEAPVLAERPMVPVDVDNVEGVMQMLAEGMLATLDYMARFNVEGSEELNTSLFKMAGARACLKIELDAGGAS